MWSPSLPVSIVDATWPRPRAVTERSDGLTNSYISLFSLNLKFISRWMVELLGNSKDDSLS